MTEFVPISSSGHLVLVPWWFGWDVPGIVFDTTLHLGTIAAVIVYFHADLWRIAGRWSRSLVTGDFDADARLGWWLILGTLPAVVAGLLWEDFFERMFASPMSVAALLVVTGLLLSVSERLTEQERTLGNLHWLDALVIGLAQALAIFPGISRSGATISAGLWRGLQRAQAARFSFLLSVPIIVGTGLKQLLYLFFEPAPTGYAVPLFVGFCAAAFSGYLSIRLLLRYLQRGKLYPFAVYCWAVGAISLAAGLWG